MPSPRCRGFLRLKKVWNHFPFEDLRANNCRQIAPPIGIFPNEPAEQFGDYPTIIVPTVLKPHFRFGLAEHFYCEFQIFA